MLVKNVKDFFKAKHQTLIDNGIEACYGGKHVA